MNSLLYIKLTNLMMVLAAKTPLDDFLTWSLENIFIVIAGLVLVLVFFRLWTTMNDITEQRTLQYLKEHGITPKVKEKAAPTDYKKMWSKLIGFLPMEKEQDLDLGHEFDGIRELDNSMPPWWLYLFYATILFGGVYSYMYMFSDVGARQAEEYEIAMDEAGKQRRAVLRLQANGIDENSVEALVDAGGLSEGQSIYKANCAACHGQLGEGGVGPNFTDKNWIHGGGIKNVFKTIKYGVPEKGMISWQAQLNPGAMQKVASFILTLEGTNPPNQKAPQGEVYDRESEVQKASIGG